MKVGHYLTLNIEHNVSQEEIKKAFHKLAHIHHPDKNGGKDAEFKKINAAYIIISNPQKRREYDMTINIHERRTYTQNPGPLTYQDVWRAYNDAKRQHMENQAKMAREFWKRQSTINDDDSFTTWTYY